MLAENRILFLVAKYFSKTIRTGQPICIHVYTEIYKYKKHWYVSTENYTYFHSKTWKKLHFNKF